MQTITLLTETSQWRSLENKDTSGLLFESAADSAARSLGDRCVPMTELMGSFEDSKRKAYMLASRLLEDEPRIAGVRHLGVFEEVVVRELSRLSLLLHLDTWLRSNNLRVCRFCEASHWPGELRRIQLATGSSYTIDPSDRPPMGVQSKLIAHLRSQGYGRSSIRDLSKRTLHRAFPFGWKLATGRLSNKPKQPDPGGWWFYTTAYTFTKIGMAYEPYLPKPLHYLVEDLSTGGRPLREQCRPSHYLYSLARGTDVPGRIEVSEAQEQIVSHLRHESLSRLDSSLRDLFLESAWFQLFCKRLLPAGIFQSRIFARWLDSIRPELVVVGNPAFEGYVLQQARERGVPSVLLQHGIFGDFCQYMELPVDHIFVRGEFFHEFLSPAAKRKASIVNFPGPNVVPKTQSGGSLLFLTTPYQILPHFHEADLEEILRTLVRATVGADCKLIVRVHPLESVAYYVCLLDRICRRETTSPVIEYSYGEGLDEVVRQSAVAVLYSSTVFLDCLRMGVPIVSFGWHDFSFKALLERHRKVFHFAADLGELGELVTKGLDGQLQSSVEVDRFLARSSSGQVASAFAQIAAGVPNLVFNA